MEREREREREYKWKLVGMGVDRKREVPFRKEGGKE
jgi:hypothetical protein